MNQSISVIGRKLIAKDEQVSVAESVTAGTIQAAMSLGKNTLDYFAGGIVTYTIDQKVRHLKISRRHAEKVNCVSRKVAIEMAKGVAKLFRTEWAISITGYAAPVPEENINALFAWVAIVHKRQVIKAEQLRLVKTSPRQAQLLYRKKVLALFATSLGKIK